MQNNFVFYLFLFTLIFFTACRTSRHVYSPFPANIPYFVKKGESKLATSYSSTDGNVSNGQNKKDEGYNLQAAYAVTDHWALTLGYSNRTEADLYPGPY